MIISHKYQYIYFPPTKTASTTITDILLKQFDAEYYTEWNEDALTNLEFKLNRTICKHVIHLPEKFQHYFTFATVRNPFNRTISQFFHPEHFQKWHGKFKEFIEFSMPKIKFSLCGQLKQYPEYIPPQGCMPMRLDFVLKVENLEEDFCKLPFVQQKIHLPVLNKGKTKDRYTDETQEMVKKYRENDFTRFNYPTSYHT